MTTSQQGTDGEAQLKEQASVLRVDHCQSILETDRPHLLAIAWHHALTYLHRASIMSSGLCTALSRL